MKLDLKEVERKVWGSAFPEPAVGELGYKILKIKVKRY